MKIYTKTGDEGETGLFAGPRVTKDHARIEAYGTVDELNAVLGWVRAKQIPAELDACLERIQSELFAVGAELAAHDPARLTIRRVGDLELSALEQEIDRWESQLAPLRNFILPGGHESAATLHVARTVCRRAERRVVSLLRDTDLADSSQIVTYLNRLGDLLFVAARWANLACGRSDTPWRGEPVSRPLNPETSGGD